MKNTKIDLKLENKRQKSLNQYYSKGASAYSESMKKHSKFVSNKDLIGFLNFEEGDNVLDVGTGTGKNYEFISKGVNITGFDINENMVKLAKKQAKKLNIPVEFVMGDVREMPFKNNQFDIVIATYALSACSNSNKALDEIHRVTAKKGLVGILDFPSSGCYLKGGVGGIDLYSSIHERISQFKIINEKQYPDTFAFFDVKLLYVLKKK